MYSNLKKPFFETQCSCLWTLAEHCLPSSSVSEVTFVWHRKAFLRKRLITHLCLWCCFWLQLKWWPNAKLRSLACGHYELMRCTCGLHMLLIVSHHRLDHSKQLLITLFGWSGLRSCHGRLLLVAVSHCQLHLWKSLTFKSGCTLLKAVNVGFFLCLQKIIWSSVTCSITALYYNCQSLCYSLCDASITSSFSCNFPAEHVLAGSPLVFFLHLL